MKNGLCAEMVYLYERAIYNFCANRNSVVSFVHE